MRSVEISAKTLEEARKAAAFQLGVDEGNLEIEILEEPHKILGVLGSGQYRIRATYVETQPEPAPAPAEAEPAAPEPEIAPPAPVISAEVEVVPEPVSVVPPLSPPAPVTEQPVDPRPTIAERAQQITQDIMTLMGISQNVSITNVGAEQVELEIEDDDDEVVGLLIGHYGATLDALQLIVAMAANAGIEDGCRVILDVHGYRQRREETLRDMAHSYAAEVKETGQKMVVADLKGYERRIVHMELADDPDVETYSEGQDSDRRIIIVPKSPGL